MSDYPQETIDTLRNVIEAQKAKIAELHAQSAEQYRIAVFYKKRWEAELNRGNNGD